MTNIIGKNVKALRESIGFTQANIATFLNLDQSMISKVEKGEKTLSIDMLEKLSCLFGATVEEIEKDIIKEPSLLTKYKANELIIENNMEAFSAINKIAMNVTFMDELLNEKTNN
ncbi:MAG: helix-turn-helix transcriptional regulator [Candidatus Caccosoma sp.]|nr:helix-turn-helix transcriptional regulator [Candidatus Caccosoma sp.]